MKGQRRRSVSSFLECNEGGRRGYEINLQGAELTRAQLCGGLRGSDAVGAQLK